MNGLLIYLRGCTQLSVTGADPERLLNRLSAEDIPFWGIETVDAFSVRFSALSRDCKEICAIAERLGCAAAVCEKRGLSQRIGALLKRPLLLISLAAALFAALVLPSHVWFYRVEGNKTVPSAQILRAVQDAGASVGIYGPDIHPQQIRYRVLLEIPELRWLTVTQNGCCAVITVRENESVPKPIDRKQPRDLVASIGGMITDITALDGSSAVKPGDVVTPGQTLINGTMDLEYAVRICRAEGEVYARTWRTRSAVFPKTVLRKGAAVRRKTQYSLQVGKKRIKLSFGSGFSGGVCDKMTVSKPLALPGGYTLPISLVEETVLSYEPMPQTAQADAAYLQMQDAIERAVDAEMIAGEITKTYLHTAEAERVYTLTERLECKEMIARPRAIGTKGDDADGRTDNRRGADGAAH